MIPAPLPPNEAERLDALRRYEILDTLPEEAFDRITRIAAQVLDVPIALVSLVDETRQWFKSAHGLAARETPRDIAFCAHAILEREAMVVADAAMDPRFADNPLVTNEPHIRFHAGAQLRTADGFSLGTLCAIDQSPREITQDQLRTLADLAQIVVDEMELRLMAKQAIAAETARCARGEKMIRHLIDHSPSAIYLKDLEGRIYLANRELARWYGRSGRNAVGKTAHDVLPRPCAIRCAAGDAEAIASRSIQVFSSETRLDDGSRRALVQTKFPIFGSTGQVAGVGTICTLTADLPAAQATDPVESRLGIAGQLAAGVAHHCNDALAVILGHTELLAERLGTHEEPVGEILRATKRGTDVVHGLLAFSQRQNLVPCPVDLGGLLGRLADDLNHRAAPGIHVELRTDDGDAVVSADPRLLETMVRGLADNALEAMPDGGILLLETSRETVVDAPIPTEAMPAPGSYLTLRVCDSGRGIDPDSLPRVVEPFFTTKQVGQGPGLGLSMAHGFARQSGGDLTISSLPGRGTQVEVMLPCA